MSNEPYGPPDTEDSLEYLNGRVEGLLDVVTNLLYELSVAGVEPLDYEKILPFSLKESKIIREGDESESVQSWFRRGNASVTLDIVNYLHSRGIHFEPQYAKLWENANLPDESKGDVT